MRGSLSNLWCLAFLGLFGCAPEKAKQYQSGENPSEIVSLLNARDYQKAVWILESRMGKVPAAREDKELLAQALLGRSGFEPLSFAAKVAGPFSNDTQKNLLGSCSRAPLEGSVSYGCVVKRITTIATSLHRNDLERAISLLRSAHPNPLDSPPWKNAWIGSVELVSLLARVGRLHEQLSWIKENSENPSLSPFTKQDLLNELKEAWREAQQSLARARNSGDKINKLLTGNRNIILFSTLLDSAEPVEAMGLRKFFEFLRTQALSPSQEIQYGTTLDAIEALLQAQ